MQIYRRSFWSHVRASRLNCPETEELLESQREVLRWVCICKAAWAIGPTPLRGSRKRQSDVGAFSEVVLRRLVSLQDS